MTKLLDKAVEMVRRLPETAQDDIARTILDLAADEPEPIDPAHLLSVLTGLRQAEQGEFATDEEVRAALRRFEA